MSTVPDHHLRMLGARILNEANDLKRTPAAMAAELGFAREEVDAIVAGTASRERAEALIQAMARNYPLSLSDLWIEPDDSDAGVVLMDAAATARSARIFNRKDRTGALSPYYEYRDTAMSRLSPFRPEWIEELRIVADADPGNPDVAFNKGHFLHQATFFIGPVNFYWEAGGRRHCAELNTGDSNYITPFVPHSFANRDPSRRGLIIACTYAGHLRTARSELARIGADGLEQLAGDLHQAGAAFASRLARHLAAESMSAEDLAERLVAAGCTPGRAAAVAAGSPPEPTELAQLAACLHVRISDLLTTPVRDGEDVIVCRRSQARVRNFGRGNVPVYRLAELARSRHQPLLKGFDVEVLGPSGDEIRHGLHEYLYNYGNLPVTLTWAGGRTAVLGPGDSACIHPMIPHALGCQPVGGETGRLVMIRVPGAVTDAALDEYAAFGPSRARTLSENEVWF